MSRRRVRLAGVLAACAALITPSTAAAAAGFGPDDTGQLAVSSLQAGAHADLITDFELKSGPDFAPLGELRDVRVSLPAGFWGAPAAFPTCSVDAVTVFGSCPAAAQVGVMDVWFHQAGTSTPPFQLFFPFPVYNVEHGPDVAAELGALPLVGAFLRVNVRSSDYGLDTVDLSLQRTALQITRVRVHLWGVPADHNGSGAAREPFLTNPDVCDRPLEGTVSMDQWDAPGVWETGAMPVVPDGAPPGTPAQMLTGCDRLPPLSPQLSVSPAGSAVDTPSGYDVDVKVPQIDNPDGLSTPTVRDLTVAFPAGVAISPAASEGLATCSDSELSPGTDAAPACPAASQVGAVEIKTPALAEPLEGAMYLGDPQDGHLFRLFLVAKGPGVMLKLRGDAVPDPVTGAVTTTFHDTPPLPFSELHVRLKDGSTALLANPLQCGTYTATATLAPYGGGAAETATSDFGVSADGEGAACPPSPPFGPRLRAGVMSPVAGASSAFRFRLSRDDGNGLLGAIADVHLPAGLIADVRTVPICGTAEAAAGTCPAATRVGSVHVGVGSGATPLYLPGSVYLTGPYAGAPFGLAIVVNAITGPYDLGRVVVRAAVSVNPDASLSVRSDPLPTILDGVPLRMRDVVLDLDRPGFMLNPTSCAPSAITATAVSLDGARASLADPFQVGDCGALGYRPKLSLRLGARGASGTTSLTARVTTRPGDANSRRIVVALPKQVGLNLKNAQSLCSAAELAARQCPAASVVGHASVDSILHQPLTGPVYFVEGVAGGKGGTALPRLWIPLTGDGVTIDLMAQSSLRGGRIVTTFDPIPDVPFRTFVLKIAGGQRGILVMSRGACRTRLRASVVMDGYSGAVVEPRRVIGGGWGGECGSGDWRGAYRRQVSVTRQRFP